MLRGFQVTVLAVSYEIRRLQLPNARFTSSRRRQTEVLHTYRDLSNFEELFSLVEWMFGFVKDLYVVCVCSTDGVRNFVLTNREFVADVLSTETTLDGLVEHSSALEE